LKGEVQVSKELKKRVGLERLQNLVRSLSFKEVLEVT
jgi:hypothetical protein